MLKNSLFKKIKLMIESFWPNFSCWFWIRSKMYLFKWLPKISWVFRPAKWSFRIAHNFLFWCFFYKFDCFRLFWFFFQVLALNHFWSLTKSKIILRNLLKYFSNFFQVIFSLFRNLLLSSNSFPNFFFLIHLSKPWSIKTHFFSIVRILFLRSFSMKIVSLSLSHCLLTSSFWHFILLRSIFFFFHVIRIIISSCWWSKFRGICLVSKINEMLTL